MYKAIIAIGLVAATYLVAGCGGGSDQSATAVVTKAQFIKQAETICNETRNWAEKTADAWERAQNRRLDIDSALTQVIGPTLKREAELIQSLAPPQADKANLERMIENLSTVASALTQGTSSGPISAASRAFAREVKAYGLEACQI